MSTPPIKAGSGSIDPRDFNRLIDNLAAAGVADPIGWTWVTKAADESVASSITLQNDDELFFATVNGGIYEVQIVTVFASPTGGSGPDIKVAFGEDSTARGLLQYIGFDSSDTAAMLTLYPNATSVAQLGTAAANRSTFFFGVYWAGGGTAQVKWAQNSSNVTPTIMRAGSVLRYRKIA